MVEWLAKMYDKKGFSRNCGYCGREILIGEMFRSTTRAPDAATSMKVKCYRHMEMDSRPRLRVA